MRQVREASTAQGLAGCTTAGGRQCGQTYSRGSCRSVAQAFADCIWVLNLLSCCWTDASYFVLWTVFKASAALARKKGKNLHDDVAIFWHKKKTSEFSVIFCTVSNALCAGPFKLWVGTFPQGQWEADSEWILVSQCFLGLLCNLL